MGHRERVITGVDADRDRKRGAGQEEWSNAYLGRRGRSIGLQRRIEYKPSSGGEATHLSGNEEPSTLTWALNN